MAEEAKNQEQVQLRDVDASRSMQDVIRLRDSEIREIANHYNLEMTNHASNNKAILINYFFSIGWTPSDAIQTQVQQLTQVQQQQQPPDDDSVNQLIDDIINGSNRHQIPNSNLQNNYNAIRGTNINERNIRYNPMSRNNGMVNGHGITTTDQVCSSIMISLCRFTTYLTPDLQCPKLCITNYE